MTYVIWFSLSAGAAIVLWWIVAVMARKVPELTDRDPAIYLHLAAEAATAAVLIVGAVLLWVEDTTVARTLTGIGLGMLLYTAINSPGYYLRSRDRAMLGMFAVVAAATIAACGVLLTG